MSTAITRLCRAMVATFTLAAATSVFATPSRATSLDDVRAVAPALADYDQVRLKGDVWNRPGLSPRDRSLVTIAVMISRGQTATLAEQLRLGLDNGLTPAEISEMLTHRLPGQGERQELERSWAAPRMAQGGLGRRSRVARVRGTQNREVMPKRQRCVEQCSYACGKLVRCLTRVGRRFVASTRQAC